LPDNGFDVRVISVAGQLTDHYNPVSKTVNLSEAEVYNQRNAAAAVARMSVVMRSATCRWLSMVNYAF
jgi:Zn-dependent membrane protease YugP